MDHLLIDKVKALFHKLFQKRLLIRLIGIRFSDLVRGSYQFDLFDDMTEKVMLYSAMDKLRDRFGENIIQRASIVGMKKREFLNPFKG